jgi:hypothetical protein
MRNASTRIGNEARHLLDASAGGADDADVAPRHDVGKRKWHPSDDGRPAVGAHYQEPELASLALQRHLVAQRHVVREDHDVETAP